MKMNQLVTAAAFMAALSMTAPAAWALSADQVKAVKKAVTSVAAPEMPAKAAELVSKASKDERKDVAVLAVKTAIYKNRTVAAAVVAAVAKAAPEVAADVTLAASEMEHEQVSAIASAAVIAAPTAKADITASANKGFFAPVAAPTPTPTSLVAPAPSFAPTTPIASFASMPGYSPSPAGFGAFQRGSAAAPVSVTVTTTTTPISPTGGNGSGSFSGIHAQPAGPATPVDYTQPRGL